MVHPFNLWMFSYTSTNSIISCQTWDWNLISARPGFFICRVEESGTIPNPSATVWGRKHPQLCPALIYWDTALDISHHPGTKLWGLFPGMFSSPSTHVPTYVSTHVPTHAHTHACTHANTHARMHAFTLACMHVLMHVCIYAHTHVHVYIRMQVRMHVCIHACTLSLISYLPLFLFTS